MSKTIIKLLLSVSLGTPLVVAAAEAEDRMREDKTHVDDWNQFARDALGLHERLIKQHPVKKTERVGGYADMPDYYVEHVYHHAGHGAVISKVRYERKNPDVMHTIEVYVNDKQGRVLRDYSAAYLPDYRNAPVQTLINLHNYNGDLHSFRQFDASRDLIYEFCEGQFNGKKVQLRLFEDDLAGISTEVDAIMASPLYKACFDGVPTKPGKYVRPR